MLQAISAGHETTLHVAKEVLLAKGNAFDAAIAAHLAMYFAEPCMASAGGNGFALTRTANGSIKFVDFFCQTPRTKFDKDHLDFYPVLVDFGGDVEEFHVGLGSAAVPGSIAGVFALHRMHGTIPMKDLIAPAIQLAKEGVPLSKFQAYDFQLLHPIFQKDESVKDIFFKDGKVKKEGDLIQMPGMADFLEFIIDEGERGFYHGDISRIITEDSIAKGGFLRREDFEQYQVNILDPFTFSYRDRLVHTGNGPSKGGAMLALTLAQFNENPESIANAIARTQAIIQNEDSIEMELHQLHADHNYKLHPSISSNRGTSHFNILDKWGNAVALTCSLGEGCGYFIPDTNMQLNNMMGEIFLLPNGAHSWTPNTRMHSMMCPTMISDHEKNIELITGSGGANRIPYSMAQVIYHLYGNGRSLQESTSKGRVHFQDLKYQVEKGYDFTLQKDNVNFWESTSLYFGGVHSIYKSKDRLEAVADQRRFGVAEVF